MKIPRDTAISAIDRWEESFFRSEFTHAAGVQKHCRFAGGLVAMWQSLEGKWKFPSKYLRKLSETLGDFVRDHDRAYRNQR